ncbi:hypothetical protein HDU84_000205 [Entophlyctis sp. JEL0112]|nr:hypothetical protein HDU84_000205 [Entophlyctis sp. JEL0112]
MASPRVKGTFQHWTLRGGAITKVFVVAHPSDAGSGRRGAVSSSSATPKTVCVVIPGNPGIVEYYAPFSENLFNAVSASRPDLDLEVVALQNPGHSLSDHNHTDADVGADSSSDLRIIASWNKVLHNAAGSTDPLTLEDQIEHKIAVFDHIRSLYPTNTRFIVAGHSIGAYMTLNLVKRRADANIVQSIYLFPTLTHIAKSKNGQVVSILALPGIRHLLAAIVFLLRPIMSIFPVALYAIVSLFTGIRGSHLAVTCEELVHHVSGFHALTLGHHEMRQVTLLDEETIEKNLDRMVFYYGPEDKWADRGYFEALKRRFPDARAYLCEDSIPHDFVIERSEAMARKVAMWLGQQ